MKKFFFIFVCFFLIGENGCNENNEKIEIKIALYDSISPSINLLEKALHYGWGKYEMNVRRISFKDIINGSLKNYDVLIIGASGRQYFHGLIPKWREEVKEFIEDGGGYVGICGGANIMTKGYEKPKYLMDFIINKASLKIIDAYINDEQNEEWQYLWKEGVAGEPPRGNIPIKNSLLPHPIFGGIRERYITYGGGPGLYNMEKAKGIAIYEEEPMNVAPIHYFPCKLIKTDIKGYYSAAETTYGNGRVIIFGMHPEIPPRLNATIKEYFGLSIYSIPRYVYRLEGGKLLNYSYNWWILRRAIAYVCNLPLPPIEELCIFLHKEENKVVAYVENAKKVEFYVDGKLYYEDKEPPYEIEVNGKRVKAVAYGKGYAWDEIRIA